MRCLLIAVVALGACSGEATGPTDAGSSDAAGIDGADAHVAMDLGGGDLRRTYDLAGVPDGFVPGGPGWPCAFAEDCSTGFCVGAVCCDDLCDPTDPNNLCKACNVPGWEGRCTFAAAGSDPRSQCAQDPPSTCGRDGLCDGQGRCRKWSAATACTNPSCASGAVTYPAACDGQGTCRPAPAPVSCAPYRCGTNGCRTSCLMTSQCAAGQTCATTACGNGKLALGQSCASGPDCASGFCAEGVCCQTACAQLCFSCALPGTTGTCTAVPSGGDPLAQCAASARSGCGLDGECDGAGACRKWPAGTPCLAPTCRAGQAVGPSACDGAGACVSGPLTSCGAYACDPIRGACFVACTGSAQCAPGHPCSAGICS